MRSPYEAYTAHHHLRGVAGAGVVAGIFLLNPEFARRSLGASEAHIFALLLIPALAQTAAVFLNPVDPSRGLIRRPFLSVAIPAYLLLLLPLLGLLPPGPTAFVALVAGCGALAMLLIPVQNGILAHNYGATTRGRRFGMANAVQALAIILVSVPAGWVLDHEPDAWPWLYAVAAGAGTWAYLHWARLKQRRAPPPPAHLVTHASPFAALWRDRHFLAFEAAFMAYGLGFLMLQPVLPLVLVDDLKVSYTQAGIAKGAVFWSAMVLAGPWLGRLSDRIGILRLAVLAFLMLALFPVVLLVLPNLWGLYLGFAVFGLAMSGVFLAWSLGPIRLARGRNPGPYLNAHLGLVGIRALVGMGVGLLMYQAWGSGPVFVTVVALEIVAAAAMVLTARAVEQAEASS